MTTVSGVLRDAKGMALPGVAVTLRYVPAVIGYSGGAVAQNNLTYITSNTGLLTMPGLVAGPYDLSIAMPIGTSAAVTAAVTARLVVNGEATQTLEDALQTTIGEVTPTILSLAIAAADRAEAAAGRAEVAASTLGVEACTFRPRDYIPAEQMVHILNGNTALQDETIVTAGLRAMHDAGMAWARAGSGRIVTFRYVGAYAVNDEIFSEAFADNLWTIGYGVGRLIFEGEGSAVFKVKNWLELARIRRSGLYKVASPLGEVSTGATTPIVVVAAGQSNIMADPDATDGTFRVNPLVKIFNAQTGQFSTADLKNASYLVSQDVDAGLYGTIGGGKNNLGVAFCHRLAEETGRQVYLIVNGKSGQSIAQWIGSGTASVLFKALNQDVTTALAAIGRTKVDYFLWQQGEADAADTTYATKVQTLLAQLGARTWWGTNTYFLAGEPCQSSLNANLANLLTEVRKIEADGNDKTRLVSSYGLPYIAEGIQQHFSGAGLWALGYGRYFQAFGSDAAQLGVGDPVPTALFRWEQKTGYSVGPTIRNISIVGTATDDVPEDDPIGLKIVRANTLQMAHTDITNIRNIGRMMEGVVNSREVQCTIEGCGFQPTIADGSGFISETVRFDVTGTEVVASEPVFTSAMNSKVLLLHGAGPNGHVHRAFMTYVDSTHATLSAAASVNVTATTGSFDVLNGSMSAGSNVLTLARADTVNYLGRYVMVLFAGSGSTPNLDHLVSRVTGQVGNILLLASPARFASSSVPVIVAPADFIGRTTDDYPRNGGRASASANDIQIYGQRNEIPSYKGRSSAANLFINDALNVDYIGGKIHGQPPIYNNFGSNAAIYITDNCDGLLFDAMQLKWGKYSGTYGSQIVTGQSASVTLRDVQIGNNFAASNARHFYLAPRSGATAWNVMLSGLDQSGNGWPNTNQGLVRYGPYGSSKHLTALGPLVLEGTPIVDNPNEPVTRHRSVRSASAGFGTEPTTTAVLAIGGTSAYVPQEMWMGDDRFLWRMTEVGLLLGKNIGTGDATFPVEVDWGAPSSSLVLTANYAQIRKPRMISVPAYANNAAALAGGLVAGETYQVSGTNPRQLAIVY